MNTVEQVVGPAVAEWDEKEPLRWTMLEIVGIGTRAETKVCFFDLTDLQHGHSLDFLIALKGFLIDRRLTAKLSTIRTDAFRIRAVLKTCQDAFARPSAEVSYAPPIFDRISADLLVGLWAVKECVPGNYLETFKTFFRSNRYNARLFEPGLADADFPQRNSTDGSGLGGKVSHLRRNVLASALTRATLIEILNITEYAFENGTLNLGFFAYSRLLLSRAARPESFRLLRLKDLHIDENSEAKTYYLAVTIPKSRAAQRPVATIRLHPDVGRILDLQRIAVAERLGPLIEKINTKNMGANQLSQRYTVGDLPLFPAGVKSGRISKETEERLGVVRDAATFITYYSAPLQALTLVNMTHNALRHTIGTQLAIAGCSTATIAGVLLHASKRAAGVYVDLVFSGAIDELSDSLESAFLQHFPVIKEFASVRDDMDPGKRIVSTSPYRLQPEVTGECGRREICQYAPITCYECPRFKPCYDADHSVNLDRVTDEIAAARVGGLPRVVDVKRYEHIANRIRVVISICNSMRGAVADGKTISDRPL